METLRFDHLVLTVTDVDRTVGFYEAVLHMQKRTHGDRVALHFGDAKLNLHAVDAKAELVARRAEPGTADLCLRCTEPVEAVAERAVEAGAEIIAGPVDRIGARARLRSIYFRDPDGNLVEVANETFDEADRARANAAIEAGYLESSSVREPFAGVRVRTLWGERGGPRALVLEMDAGARWEELDVHEPGPEEVYVVEGVFCDGAREYPAGTFLHHPVGSAHSPVTDTGCTLFVFYPEG